MEKYRPKKQKQKALKGKKESGLVDSNSGNYWQIFDIKLFGRDKSEVLNVLTEKLASGTKKYWIATVNPEFIMIATKDDDFNQILKKTNINVVDGIGLVWAKSVCQYVSLSDGQIKRFFKKIFIGFRVGVDVLRGKYKDQVASGADLIIDLVKMAKKMNKKIFLLGGWGDRAEKTAKYFRSQISDLRCQWCQGEPEINNDQVVEKINKFKPDILLVAYGMKKQEFWIDKNLKNLDVGLVIGVGRSFDYYSGDLKRAPDWVRKMGMEWLYSLIKEPKRFKRQLALPKFILKVLYN